MGAIAHDPNISEGFEISDFRFQIEEPCRSLLGQSEIMNHKSEIRNGRNEASDAPLLCLFSHLP